MFASLISFLKKINRLIGVVVAQSLFMAAMSVKLFFFLIRQSLHNIDELPSFTYEMNVGMHT